MSHNISERWSRIWPPAPSVSSLQLADTWPLSNSFDTVSWMQVHLHHKLWCICAISLSLGDKSLAITVCSHFFCVRLYSLSCAIDCVTSRTLCPLCTLCSVYFFHLTFRFCVSKSCQVPASVQYTTNTLYGVKHGHWLKWTEDLLNRCRCSFTERAVSVKKSDRLSNDFTWRFK